MKKSILSLAVVGLLFATSCKKENTAETTVEPETTETVAEETTTEESVEASTEIAGVAIPEFSSPEANAIAKEYTGIINGLVDAAKSGDAVKLQELQTQLQEYAPKLQELAKTLSPEDAQKWGAYAIELQKKMTGQ